MARTKHNVARMPRLEPKVAWPAWVSFGRVPRWSQLPLRMVSPEPRPEPEKKKRRAYRFRWGTGPLEEIMKYQRSTGLLLPFAPFVRLVKEITCSVSADVNRWTHEALLALLQSAEYHLVDVFEKANLCAIHANRVTIIQEDIQLARLIGAQRNL